MSERKTYARKAMAAGVRASLPTDKGNWGTIANPLHSGSTGNVLGAADEILDMGRGKFQDEVNDELEEAIQGVYAIVYANHARASIRIANGLTNGVIEKGASTKVTVAWAFGVDGMAGDTGKPASASILKGGAEWVSDALATASKEDTLTDSASYTAKATFPHGAQKESTVSVTARYPIYVLCSAKEALDSADALTPDGDNHKTYLLNNPGNGTEVSVMNAAAAQYIWVCVPADMEVTKMQMGGQPMTYKPAVGLNVEGKGTYRSYRSFMSQDAGQKTFNIWGGNTTETPPAPPTPPEVEEGWYSLALGNDQPREVAKPAVVYLVWEGTTDPDKPKPAPTAGLNVEVAYEFYATDGTMTEKAQRLYLAPSDYGKAKEFTLSGTENGYTALRSATPVDYDAEKWHFESSLDGFDNNNGRELITVKRRCLWDYNTLGDKKYKVTVTVTDGEFVPITATIKAECTRAALEGQEGQKVTLDAGTMLLTGNTTTADFADPRKPGSGGLQLLMTLDGFFVSAAEPDEAYKDNTVVYIDPMLTAEDLAYTFTAPASVTIPSGAGSGQLVISPTASLLVESTRGGNPVAWSVTSKPSWVTAVDTEKGTVTASVNGGSGIISDRSGDLVIKQSGSLKTLTIKVTQKGSNG